MDKRLGWSRSSVLVCAALASACGGSHRVGDVPAIDAAVLSDAAATDARTSDPDGGTTAACETGRLCLEVNRLGSGAVQQGILAVVWFQVDDDGPDPDPVVAFELPTPSDPGWAREDILLDALAPPPDAVRWCPRDCDDEAICPCTGNPQVALAVVGVLEDTDSDGTLGTAEITSGRATGMAMVVVANANDRYVPAPIPWSEVFADGVIAGTQPYRVIEAGVTDDLGVAPPGSTFVLSVCTDDMPVCDPPTPDVI